MEFRKIFDTIPEKFDKWRPRYCEAAFKEIIETAKLDEYRRVLEIGPGTGQATTPILNTGCEYLAIELGEHLTAYMKEKYADYKNFHIINDDFITHEFDKEQYDLVYSAATIQWIPEDIGFSKVYEILKPGGIFAMMYMRGEYKSPNEKLYDEIQRIYKKYFRPEIEYTCHLEYGNVVKYGFTEPKCRVYPGQRRFTADDYVEHLGTHCDHIVLRQEYREAFYEGIRTAILEAGDQLVMNDEIVLYLAKKPCPVNSSIKK